MQQNPRKACHTLADIGENSMSTISTPHLPRSAPAKAAPPAANPLASAVVVIIAAIAAIIILKIPALTAPWSQGYDPTGHWWISTLIAALPVVVLLGSLALGHVKAHYAALLGLATALLVAIFGFHMPARLAAATAVYGAGYGLFPIGWIVLNVIFMYQLTVEIGRFKVLQHSMTGITQDRRLQLLLIAFCFGAFFEGAAGFGTPVAVTAAILIGLGFRPLQASGLSLIANTAPVAFGALGTPIIALAKVTGFSEVTLGAMAGRILTPFCVLVPFWLICAFVGWGGMLEIWPAILVAGVSFAIPQYFISNYHGPWLANIGASVISMVCLVGFLFIWHPKRIWTFEGEEAKTEHRAAHGYQPRGSHARLGSLGHPQRDRFHVGHADRQEPDEHAGEDLQVDGDLADAAQQDHQSAVPGHRPEQSCAARPARGDQADERARGLWPELGQRNRLRHSAGRHHLRLDHGTEYSEDLLHLRPDHHEGALLAADHCGHDGHRIHDALFGTGRHHGSGLRAHRTSVSVLRHAAGLAGRGADRIGYVVQRAVRQPAEDHRAAGERRRRS